MCSQHAFPPFKFVAVLSMEASQETRLPWQTPGGIRLSTLPGGRALISTVDVAMPVESVCCHCRAAKASVANESYLIMCCSEVIHDGPLILLQFPTPQAVHESGKVLEGLRVMDPL